MYIGPGITINDVPLWDGAKWIPHPGTSSPPVIFQTLLGRVRMHWLEGLSGGSGVQVAGAFGFVGTATSFAADWSTPYKSSTKSGFISSAAAGTSCEVQGTGASSYALSSTAPFAGGFIFYTRVAAQVAQPQGRCFYGFSANGAALPNANPSALLNCIGISSDQAEANLSIISNDGAGVATRATLGASFPALTSATDYYEIIIWASPGQTTLVSFQITNIITNAVASGTVTSDLPTPNTSLFPRIWLNNGTTAAASTMAYFSVFAQSGA